MKRILFILATAFPLSSQAQTTTTLVPLQSVWKYLDNGSNQGTAWRAAAFNDTTWAQGPAQLGYGDGDEATVVGYGPNAAAKYITTYFRRSFTVSGAAAFTSAGLRVRRDDGVVIYLNGTEIYRTNLPAAPATITHTTLAPAAIGGTDESALLTSAVNAALLVEGNNVLAVEMHQNAGSSSDLTFDMELTATAPPAGIPVANAQSVTLAEDTSAAVTLTGSDPEGSPLTYVIVTAPGAGTLTGSPPALTYTPPANFAGAASFAFKVNDGTYDSAPATVSLTVTPVNDPPAANTQTVNTGEGSAVTLTLTGSDVESHYGTLPDYTQQLFLGDLTAITDGLSGATWNADTGTLFFIRNVSTGAGHSYEYTANGTLVRTITQSGFQDTEAIAWMYGNTYAIAEENNFQRITICTILPGATTLNRTGPGNVTWNTPVGSLLNLGVESLCYDAGRDLLYYIAEKPAGGTWNIYAMNPATGVSTALCNLNTSVFTSGVATDLSDIAFDRATDTLICLSEESDKVIRVSRAGAVLEQKAIPGFTQAEAVALTPDRLRLFIGGEPKQFARYVLPADTLTYALVGGPSHGTLSGMPPLLTYTPAAGFWGTDSFTFNVSDGTLTTAPVTVTINVASSNHAPAATPKGVTAIKETATPIVLTGTDEDGDPLTFAIAAPPGHGTLTGTPPNVVYTPEAGWLGPDSFTFTADDGIFTSAPATVTLNVIPPNAPPVAEDDSVTLDEDNSGAVGLAAADNDGDPLIYVLSSLPVHGTLTGTVPNLTYTPAANYHGADSFTFHVNDGIWNSNSATVTLTVSSVPDAPVAQAGSGSIEAGYPLSLTLAGTDADGDALSYAVVTPPAHGILTGTPPNVTYTADIQYAGADVFSFTVSDGTLTSAPAEVAVSVAPYNLPPVAANGSFTTAEDTPAAVTLSASDPEGLPLSFTIIAQPQIGSLSGTAPNLTYTPFPNVSGGDSFTWTASDGSKTSAQATATITVTPVNDPPVAQSFVVPTESGTPAPVVLAGTDVEGAPLTFTVPGQPAHGVLSGTAPGLTYTPDAGYSGADEFTYFVNDGEADSAVATVSLTVSAPALDTLVTAGAVWKYLDNGSNQGTAWRAPNFDDTAWAQGPAELGYGDGGEGKVIGFGPDANNKYVTSYFRREFQLPNPNVIGGVLKLDLLRDDGAIVYLNGTEIVRSGMPAGAVAYNQLASANIGAPDESTFYTFTVNRSLLVAGRNVLAVEVHQGALNSSDLSFNLRLYESVSSLSRGPYVQMTGTDRATVRWRTDVATTTVLNYGTDAGALNGTFSNATPKTEHEVTLTGLVPDTRYYYAAAHSTGTLASGLTNYFTTHPPPGTERPYRFWVLGDPGTGDANQRAVRDAFYAWNGTRRLDAVLMLGDNVYDTGTDAEFQTKMFEIYPTVLRNTTFWPTFGNHDAGSASSATQSGPYYNLFTLPKFGEAGGVASGTEAYYSFDHGNIHFVCLDSEGTSLAPGGLMANWLEQDLSATMQEWIVAYWHHPPYCRGTRDSDNPALDGGREKNMREVFVPIFENHGVDLLLFGHEHNYQRSKFIDGHYGVSATFNPATMLKQAGLGDPAIDAAYMKTNGPHNGAVYAVAGSSGKLNTGTFNHPIMAVNYAELGSVVLDVNGRELQARFLNSTGVIRDNFTIVHNTAPAALAGTITGAEDAPLAVVLAGTDVEGDPLTYEILTPPGAGTLTGTTPDLVFTPPPNFEGETSFAYRVNDGRANSAAVTVTLVITPVNDLPEASDAAVVVDEDTDAAITLAASDIDGDALTFAITAPPVHGALSGSAPDLIYTPDANWHGTDSFTFIASDAAASSPPAVISITVAPVNDAPSASPAEFATNEDTPLANTLAATDADGDALTFTVAVPPAHGILTGTLPDLQYTPDANWNGPDSFTFTVSDGIETSAPAAVSLVVAPVNDAPAGAAGSAATGEDAAVAITLAGTDVDGDPLGFVLTSLPAHGSLSGTAPDLTYIPDANWHGTDSFSYAVTDGAAVSPEAAVMVIVAPVNDTPVAAPQTIALPEDSPAEVLLAATDVDGDALTWEIAEPPAHGTLSGTPPLLTFTPDADWHGADNFIFTASDGTESSAPAIVSIVITPVNDAPVAAAVNAATNEDTAVSIMLAGNDADGDALSFVLTSLPGHGTLSGAAPNLIYTPDPDWSGADTFSYTVTDGSAVSGEAAVTITVAPVNGAPVAVPQAVLTTEDTPAEVQLGGTDAEGDTLTFAVATAPAHGTLSGTPPNVTYTPAANWYGTDSFSFTANDGTVTSAAAAVTLTVTAVNDAPAAAPVNVSTEVGFPVSLTFSGSDVEGASLTWAVTVPPAFGTLSGSGAARTYTPNLAWSGTDQFWFTASDGIAASAPAAATITVASSGPWQLVARTGVAAPGASGATFAVLAPDFVSDAAGRASFRGTAGSVTGIWTEGAAGLEAMAAQGAPAPGVSGAVFDAVTTAPWAAGDAEVLLFGKLLAGPGGVTTSSDLGYWLRSGGSMTLVARENNPVPGLPAAARFNVVSSVATLEAGGNYAFAASVRTNSSIGISTTNDTGLWATFGAPLRLLVRENSAAPGASGGLFDTLTSVSLVSNGVGQLGFAASLKTGGPVTTANRYGLWLWDPAQFGLVARGGNAAPGTPAGAVFEQPQQPALGGAMAFRSTLVTKSGGVTNSNDTGIWALEGGSVTLTAREGFQAPGIPAGGLFGNLTEGATVNASGELAFRASLISGGGVSPANNAGLWARSRFTSNALTIVARKGAAAPGAGFATFASFDVPFLASDGGEVFTANLTSGVGGVTSSNDRGLWLRTAAGSLALSLREGTAFTLAPGITRTIAAITLPAAPGSGRTPLSDEGRLLVHLGFTDGSSALYHYVLP